MIIEISERELIPLLKSEMYDCVLDFDNGKLDVKFFNSIADCTSKHLAEYQIKINRRKYCWLKRVLATIIEYL